MAAAIFEFAAEQLESRSDLEKLEARGTLRLALKQSGLDAQSVGVDQMLVVLAMVLPDELASRGVDDPAGVCGGIAVALKSAAVDLATSASSSSPEDVFRRLASR